MPITTHCTCGQSIDGRCHSTIEGCEQLFLTYVDNHYKMEENNYPGSSYQNLFNYLHEEHGLTLLQSQMDDLINVVHKFHERGAVLPAADAVQNWFEENIDKECSASSAVYKFRLWLESLQGTRQTGAMWPLFVADKATGDRHEVNKLVYHPGNDPELHVWCDTWYGHHIIGQDCEWANPVTPVADKPYDELYRLTYSMLAHLRARTKEDRILKFAPSIRNLIEEVTKQLQAMPQPDNNEPPFLVQSEASSPAAREEDWISVEDRPLIRRDGEFWELTEDGEKEFIAAVPYCDAATDNPNKERWWIRHCYIDGEGFLYVKSDNEMDEDIAGWAVSDITHWRPLPAPPKQPHP